MEPITVSTVLSVAAVLTAGISAYTSWRSHRYVERSRQIVNELASKYAEAVGLVVLVARADPPVADPGIVAACEKLITAHRIEATVTRTTDDGSIH